MSHFIYSSPAKYVQGSGVLDELGQHLVTLGTKALIIVDDIVWQITGKRVKTSLEHVKIDFHYEHFNGEASDNAILRLADVARAAGTNIVVALSDGGSGGMAR